MPKRSKCRAKRRCYTTPHAHGVATPPPPLSSKMSARAASSSNSETASTIHVHQLTPPPSFSYVCPYIFRSADPTKNPDSLAFLETLGLRSVVLLSIEYPSKQLKQFCEGKHIQLHHFGIERRWPAPFGSGISKSSRSSTLFLSPHEMNSLSVIESIVKDALELLLDVRNHPVLVTDTYA